jgi:hypothetical protein
MSDRKGYECDIRQRYTVPKCWYAGRSPAARQITVLPDQVNDLFHHDILVVILEKRHSSKKAFDLGVDARFETRTGKVVHHRLNFTW